MVPPSEWKSTGERPARAWVSGGALFASLVFFAAAGLAQGTVEPPQGSGVRRRPVSIQAGTPAVTVFPQRRGPIHVPSTETDAFAHLDASACRRELASRHLALASAQGPDPRSAYVTLRGSLAGVELLTSESDDQKRIADCRLALALATWMQVLRHDGVTRLYFTAARRAATPTDATRGEGGHAAGLAIDVRALERRGGVRWDVSRAWGASTRAANPCSRQLLVGTDASLLRRVVCAAAEEGRFHVVVTPHFDEGHRDHVHLELVPAATEVTVR